MNDFIKYLICKFYIYRTDLLINKNKRINDKVCRQIERNWRWLEKNQMTGEEN